MNFRKNSPSPRDPELNLIPLIDVLLVILLFLVAASTFNKFSELSVNLPKTSGVSSTSNPMSVDISVSQTGTFAVNGEILPSQNPQELVNILNTLKKNHDPLRVLVYADRQATHESVVRALEAIQKADITEIQFATQIEAP